MENEAKLNHFFDEYLPYNQPDLKPYNVLALTWSFLSTLNKDFMDHSVRAAFLMLRFCEYRKIDSIEKRMLVFSTFFHDIGAYQSDEFPNLSMIDPDNTFEHSYKGYLFLKYYSPFKNYARIIYYHHARYDKKNKSKFFNFGCLLHIIDRCDVYNFTFRNKQKVLNLLEKGKNVIFKEKDVNDLIDFCSNCNVLEDMLSDKARPALIEYLNSCHFEYNEMTALIDMTSQLFEMYNITTLEHSKMVGLVASGIALCLGYTERDAARLFIAGLIHDYGKICVPLNIIEKKSSLNNQEKEIMKTHVQKTYDIVHGTIDDRVLDLAYHHHERLDGSGYPNHLKKNQLMNDDLILEVADVISALYGVRSYKKAYSFKKVKSIILELVEDGKFDEKIVNCFISNRDCIMTRVYEEGRNSRRKYFAMQKEGIKQKRLKPNFCR